MDRLNKNKKNKIDILYTTFMEKIENKIDIYILN